MDEMFVFNNNTNTSSFWHSKWYQNRIWCFV